MALPAFYLVPRKTKSGLQQINLFFWFNGSRLQYYTGVRIDPMYYLTKKMVSKKDANGKVTKDKELIDTDRSKVDDIISEAAPGVHHIKSRLNRISQRVLALKDKAEANGIALTKRYLTEGLDEIFKKKEEVVSEKVVKPFTEFFADLIKEMDEGKRTIKKGKNAGREYTYNARKNYKSTLAAINRYIKYISSEKKIKQLHFSDINIDFYNKFSEFCYSAEENKEVSTLASYVKDIKSVMDAAYERGLQTENGHKGSDFVMPSYEADTIYLTLEQIDLIAQLALSDKSKVVTHQVPKRDKFKKNVYDSSGHQIMVDEKVSYTTLDKCRDLSLIGFYTGLRYGNFSNLDLKSIEGGFIKVKQVKTGARVSVPIMQKLLPVLAKYPNELPTLSNAKFNIYIKLVAKLAGLDELREIKNYRGGKVSTEMKPLYTLVSSHTCRRSYATNMFKLAIPAMLIMSSTGHSSEKSFLKYIRASNEDKAILMAEQMRKLGL